MTKKNQQWITIYSIIIPFLTILAVFTVLPVPLAHAEVVHDDTVHITGTLHVGNATLNPIQEFHIVHGDTPAVRLEQDDGYGWTPYSWDIAGNEANFFVRDVTNASALPFRIQAGAPENALYIQQSGNVGLGTGGPTASLHVIESDDSEETLLKVATSTTEVFTVSRTGDTLVLGNLEVGSSRSYKQNIHAVGGQEALKALGELSPVHFSYRSTPDVHSIGFIAEDVPDIVATKDRKSLRPMDIVAVLTKAVQEQQKTIEILSRQIAALQVQETVASH